MRYIEHEMYETTIILALGMLAGLAAYFAVESAHEAAPPRAEGARNIINAVAAAVASALLILTAALLIYTTACKPSNLVPRFKPECAPPPLRENSESSLDLRAPQTSMPLGQRVSL
jgi:hypothetical protein